MKLSDIGEFGLIKNMIMPNFEELVTEGYTGIGDDCAVMPLNEETCQVVSTDMLVENVHFLRKRISPYELGYKSLAVNLSDIAAMGARPTGTFLSLGLPGNTDMEWIGEFIRGYKALAREEHTPLLGGGDCTSSSRRC